MLPNKFLLHNRYRIEKKIGQGGMGAVYKARDETLDTTVAVKEALVSDTQLLTAFRKEATRLARLRHPALPNVIDHFVEGHSQYLVMEYIEGQDLVEMLSANKNQPFPVAQVLLWADQLLAVLEYLHAQTPPIIHRDIKPHNLKLMPDGTLILLDFGLAKGGLTVQHAFGPSSLYGYTMGYAAPEQIFGRGTDARTDLYAVSITLWTLLTGEAPIDARIREQAATHQTFDPLYPANKLNPQVPVPIAQILHQAVALDPNYRPPNAKAMRQMLRDEAQRDARARQQAEEARRRAEQEKFRRDAETARQQALQEQRRRQQAEQQAQQERQRRQQAEQQEQQLRQQIRQTSEPTQLAGLSWPLVLGLIGLFLFAIIVGAIVGNSLASLSAEAEVSEANAAASAAKAKAAEAEAALAGAQSAAADAEAALAEVHSTGGAALAFEGETVAAVRERGTMVCGISGTLPGFSIIEDDGSISGMDWDYCRAVAAAVFGDSEAVEARASTGTDRFPRLQNGEFDMLSRNTTWTISRDTSLGFDFAPTTFYDGQGMMVRVDSGIQTLQDLEGGSVCVGKGTTTEKNLADVFRQLGIDYEPVVFEESLAPREAYDEGRCDGWTTDKSLLVAGQTELSNPSEHTILAVTMSKEPLGPVVRHGDDNWFDIVKWTVNCTIQAEELGISSANVDDFVGGNDPLVANLLGDEGDLGQALNLSNDFCYQIIKQVGHYGEIYDRHLGPNTPFNLPRGVNSQWTEGGLLYSPPFR